MEVNDDYVLFTWSKLKLLWEISLNEWKAYTSVQRCMQPSVARNSRRVLLSYLCSVLSISVYQWHKSTRCHYFLFFNSQPNTTWLQWIDWFQYSCVELKNALFISRGVIKFASCFIFHPITYHFALGLSAGLRVLIISKTRTVNIGDPVICRILRFKY